MRSSSSSLWPNLFLHCTQQLILILGRRIIIGLSILLWIPLTHAKAAIITKNGEELSIVSTGNLSKVFAATIQKYCLMAQKVTFNKDAWTSSDTAPRASKQANISNSHVRKKNVQNPKTPKPQNPSYLKIIITKI